jgi:hypothetical protein
VAYEIAVSELARHEELLAKPSLRGARQDGARHDVIVGTAPPEDAADAFLAGVKVRLGEFVEPGAPRRQRAESFVAGTDDEGTEAVVFGFEPV